MTADELAIRDLIDTWMTATKAGDVAKILGLLAEDVVFLRAGAPPIVGRQAFADLAASSGRPHHFEGAADIQEVSVHGDIAYSRTHITVTVTPTAEANPVRRSGFTLTVFRKQADGAWVLARDANMMTAEH